MAIWEPNPEDISWSEKESGQDIGEGNQLFKEQYASKCKDNWFNDSMSFLKGKAQVSSISLSSGSLHSWLFLLIH